MLKKINVMLNRNQKWKMLGIIFLMLIGAVLETCSVTLIVPALTVVLDPNSINDSKYVKWLYDLFGFDSYQAFVIFMMVAIIVAFVLKNAFLLLQNIIQYKFIYSNQFRTSERMMINYIKRPYEFYLNADTAVIQRSITSDVNNMFAYLLALLQLMSEVIVFITLAVVLFVMNSGMIGIISALLVLVIIVIKFVLQPILEKAGKDNQDYYSSLFKWINQSVTGIKEVKIGNREKYFVEQYREYGHGYVNAVQKYSILTGTPRLLIETIAIAGMILYLLLQIINGEDVTNMLPILAAFAVGAMRLIPSANRINTYLTSMSFLKPFVMNVSDNLQYDITGDRVTTDSLDVPKDRMEVHDKIELKNITFAYPNTDKLIFDQANCEIPIGSSVGIVGTTGSGKSTIVDVLLGLLRAQEGQVLADGKDVMQDYRKWLKNVGYIPQSIFMMDDSIRKNVAFGVAEDEIDEERIWKVLKDAQLDEFVRKLPEGLETGIGERGIRISGGQRQRIGIARALYDDPEVLVLDEATSALDNDTEAAIMKSIEQLHGDKTLVIIAHRLQTIENCDIVYRVEDGKIEKER